MKKGFTLIELLVVVLILGILVAIALPSYVTSANTARQGGANAAARMLAAMVQAHGIQTGSYDSTISDYASFANGSAPVNPCTGNSNGFTINVTGNSATIQAQVGTQCGSWSPTTFSISM